MQYQIREVGSAIAMYISIGGNGNTSCTVTLVGIAAGNVNYVTYSNAVHKLNVCKR